MADAKQRTLPVPPGIAGDDDAREMIRAWVAHQGLHCSVNIGEWGDREATGWGVLLSDVARHVANALHEQSGIEPQQVLDHIREIFNSELDEPTEDATGGFVQIT